MPRTKLTEFSPVEVKADPPSKPSQSLLAKLDTCPRSAYAYLRHGGGVQSHAMSRGSAFHEFTQRATETLMQTGEMTMPTDVAIELMEDVLNNPEHTFPLADRKSLRAMASNWSKTFALPAGIVACENMIELELGDWTIRGKIDLAWLEHDGSVHIRDYKTSLNIPKQEQFERGFQCPFYALLLAEGHYEDDPTMKAVKQMPERVGVGELYPRYVSDGAMVGRYATLWTDDLVEFKSDLMSLLGKMEHGLETGEWDATPGSHCATCPAPHECPIPQEFRDIQTISTIEEASQMAELAYRLEDEVKRLKGSVREFAKAQEMAIPVGTDLEMDFVYIESKSLKKDAKKRMLENGEADLFNTSKTTRFERRKKK